MEVASLVIAWSLCGQAAPPPFSGSGSATPAATSPTAGGAASIAAPPPFAGGYSPPAEASRYGDRYATPAAAANPTVPAAGASPYGTTGGASTIVPTAATGAMPTTASAPTTTTSSPPTTGYATPPSASSGTSPGYTGGMPPASGGFSSSPGVTSSSAPATLPRAAMPDPMRPATSAAPTPAEARSSVAAQRSTTVETPVAPPAEDTSGAADLVRDAMVLPKSLGPSGKPTKLLEALTNTTDRRRQTAVVYAYWKLAAEAGEYHYAWQHVQFLKLLEETVAGTEQGADAQAARAAVAARHAEANAEWREAELRLTAAQAELIEAAGLTTDGDRPLATDLPHVGVYNTSFDKVYARRTPPARAYLLQKSLPLRRDVVAGRAQTVWAAQDAYEAAFDAYRKRQLPLDDALAAIASLRDRRSQFLTAVRRYNDEIAEYALTSAPEGTSRETLVGMLIKSEFTPKLGKAVFPADLPSADSEFVVPASFEGGDGFDPSGLQPVPDAGVSGVTPIGYQQPLPVVPSSPDETSAGVFSAGGVAAPRNVLPTANGATLATASSYAVPNLLDVPDAQPINAVVPQTAVVGAAPTNFQRGTPTLAPPREQVDAPLKFKVNKNPFDEPGLLPTSDDAVPLEPAGGKSPYSSGTQMTKPAKKTAAVFVAEPVAEIGPELKAAQPAKIEVTETQAAPLRDDAVEPVGFYDAVAGLPGPRRTQELIEQLHRTAMSATREESVQPLTLDACLAGGGSLRASRIAAYWATAEAAAARNVWLQKVSQLEALSQATMRFRESPAGAVAMLEVHGARLAAQTSEREASAELLAARWHLTETMQRSHAEPWLTAATLPHGGRYDTKLESLAVESALRRRLENPAARLAAMHEILQHRAEAVAAGDQASEAALRKFSAGQCAVAAPLEAFRFQTAATQELLADVTRYNREIADYAFRMLPSETPSSTLVDALVVDRSTARSR